MALGAMYAGLQHLWAVERDTYACLTYEANIGRRSGCRLLMGDVLDLDPCSLAPVDVLAFGFPCNDFSQVGESRGLMGKHGQLWRVGIDCLDRLQPAAFVAENVKGILTANVGTAHRQILAAMEEAGYRVHAQLYKLEEYGVPQMRHRVLYVGIRNDLGFTFTPPQPTHKAEEDQVRACEAIECIPALAANHELVMATGKVLERLRCIPAGGNAYSPDVPEHLRIKAKAQISTIYRRLKPDRPAYTVTAAGGGGTSLYHWEEHRPLTNRERARLQTFPDWFTFAGSYADVRRQIGMAVPPMFAAIIFSELVRQLDAHSAAHCATMKA